MKDIFTTAPHVNLSSLVLLTADVREQATLEQVDPEAGAQSKMCKQ